MEVKSVKVSDKLKVCVEGLSFSPSLEGFEDRRFPFIYFITITNFFHERVTIKGRKWIIKQKDGRVFIVEGNGVIGAYPSLDHGETFKYNSYHVISENALVEGCYFVELESGSRFCSMIPEFRLNIPAWAV